MLYFKYLCLYPHIFFITLIIILMNYNSIKRHYFDLLSITKLNVCSRLETDMIINNLIISVLSSKTYLIININVLRHRIMPFVQKKLLYFYYHLDSIFVDEVRTEINKSIFVYDLNILSMNILQQYLFIYILIYLHNR